MQGMTGAIRKAERLVAETPGAYMLQQLKTFGQPGGSLWHHWATENTFPIKTFHAVTTTPPLLRAAGHGGGDSQGGAAGGGDARRRHAAAIKDIWPTRRLTVAPLGY